MRVLISSRTMMCHSQLYQFKLCLLFAVTLLLGTNFVTSASTSNSTSASNNTSTDRSNFSSTTKHSNTSNFSNSSDTNFSNNSTSSNSSTSGDTTNSRSNNNNTATCPTWYHPAETEQGHEQCVCGDSLNGKVRCLQGTQVGLVVGNCMTRDGEETLVGLCPYSISNSSVLDDFYTALPKNASEINGFMCSRLNRTGLLCSRCEKGLSLAALSYTRECIECKNTARGIVLLLVLTFVPATVFFLIVMVCSVDILSGPMNAALTVVQINLAQISQNPSDILFKSSNPLSYYPMLFLVTVYGIWNFDFFRYVLPPFCISRSLTSLEAESLEYIIAVYPLLLIIATYIFVELYDKEYHLIVTMWAPFKKIFNLKCFKDLNIKHSLVTTFATFLQLVYTRIFFVSKVYLNYTHLQNSTGDTVSTALTMDASITYLSATHTPYVALAFFMLLVFNILPLLLLLLYPTKCFQLMLGCIPGINWHPLHAFMDIFQGCYKNGTNGTRDCRYFAGFNLLIRMIMLTPIDSHSLSSIKLVLVPFLFGFLLAAAKPYRRNILNLWGMFCYFLYTLNMLWILCSTYDAHLSFEIAYISHFILFSYLLFLFLVKTVKTVSPSCYAACVERGRRFTEEVKRWAGSGSKISTVLCCCCCCCFEGTTRKDLERGGGGGGGRRGDVHSLCEVDEEFPDRVNNPQDYQHLLAESGSSSYGNRHMVIASYGINY